MREHSAASQTFVRNSLYVISLTVLGYVVVFLLTLVLSRKLGSEVYGIYSKITALATILVFVMDLGLRIFSIREIARKPEQAERTFGNALVLKLIFMPLAIALALITPRMLGYEPHLTAPFFIFFCSIVLNSFFFLVLSLYIAFEDMQYEGFFALANNLLYLAAAWALTSLGYSLKEIFIAFLAINALLLGISYLCVSKKYFPVRLRADRVCLLFTLKESVVLGATSVIVRLYAKADIILLTYFAVGNEHIGWYGLAFNLFFYLQSVISMFVKALLPYMSKKALEDDARFLKNLARISSLLTILISSGILLMYAVVDKLIVFLFTDQFAGSTPAIRIMLWGVILNIPSTIYITALIAKRRQIINGAIFGIALAFSFASNIILIPRLGYLGAAWTTMLCEIVLLFLTLLYYWRTFNLMDFFNYMWKPAVALMAAVLFYHLTGGSLIMSLLAPVVLVACAALLKAFGKQEIELVTSALRRNRS